MAVRPLSFYRNLFNVHWFTIEYAYAARVLQDVMQNYKGYLNLSRKQTQYVKDNFSLDQMAKRLVEIVDKGLENVPQQVSLKLPKLKKTNQDKVKLPKLKKATV